MNYYLFGGFTHFLLTDNRTREGIDGIYIFPQYYRSPDIKKPIDKSINKPKNPTKYKIFQDNKLKFSCTICYEEYKQNDSIYVLECGHHFCCGCLDEWIKSKNIYKPNCFCGMCNFNYQVDLEQIDYSEYSCPCCRQSIKDNNMFNTGINTIFNKNNFILELYKKKQLNIFENEFNISKYNLIKMILLEYITNNPNINDKNINDYTEHIKKEKKKKSRKEKLSNQFKFKEIIYRYQITNIYKNIYKNKKLLN